MTLIVGLGNPGKEYERARHNIGFRVVDRIREILRGSEWSEKNIFKASLSTPRSSERDLLLAKPTTFMNNSGDAVLLLQRHYRISTPDIAVVYDDLDIPFGSMRVRRSGSSAGHNGVKSIIARIGEAEFCRFRIGIGPKQPERIPAEDFVLQRFSKVEEEKLEIILPAAAQAILDTLANPDHDPTATINLLGE